MRKKFGPPYVAEFDTLSDKPLPYPWSGATWDVSGGDVVNTPTFLGNELVTNGGFSVDENWTKSAGVTISDGALHFTGTQVIYAGANQADVFTSGGLYLVQLDIANLTGTVFVQEGSNTTLFILTTSTGTYQAVVRSTVGGAFRFKAGSEGAVADIDNVSVMLISEATCFAALPPQQGDISVSAQVFSPIGMIPRQSYIPAGVFLSLDSRTNPQNWVAAIHDHSRVKLLKCVGGAVSELISASSLFYEGGSVMAVKSGAFYSLYYNYVQIGAMQEITDAAILAGTYCGMYSTHSDATLDGFTLGARATPARIAIIGDSIAAISNSTGVWPYPVARRYNQGTVALSNHATTNMGVLVGTTNMAAQVTAAATDNADIIIMALGTNDNNAGDMGALQTAVENGIDTLRGTNPSAALYYMNVLPRASGDKSLVRAAIVAACAAKSVPCWDTVTDPWIVPATDTSDGLHPNAAGNVKIRDRVLALI